MKHHQLYRHQHFKFRRIIEYFQAGRDLGIWSNALIFTRKWRSNRVSWTAQTHTNSSRFDTWVQEPEFTASFHLLFFVFFIINSNHWIKLSWKRKEKEKNSLKTAANLFLKSLIFCWETMSNWFRPLASFYSNMVFEDIFLPATTSWKL